MNDWLESVLHINAERVVGVRILLPWLAMSLPWISAMAAEPAAARSGAEVYRDYCASCHSGGMQGAPVANDAGEWQPRLTKGAAALFQNAKQGVDAMPPKGTCMNCSDAELQAAIDEMLRF